MRVITIYDDEREEIVTYVRLWFARAIKQRLIKAKRVVKPSRLHINHTASHDKTNTNFPEGLTNSPSIFFRLGK